MKRSIKHNLSSSTYDVSVIIVCRNGKNVTQKCLEGISKLGVKQIVIVDNQSTDGTATLLKQFSKKDKRFFVIHNNKNNGFAEANNQGYRVSTGKYILFLNNDTVIGKDFFPPLFKSLKRKYIAAVQPMILFPDGSIDSIGSYFTPTGFLYHRAHRMKPERSFLKEDPVYSMKGACMLWKKSVLDNIGVFDEGYFAYFEETELCHRAINAGYQVMVNPTVTITHLGGFTSNTMNQEVIQYFNAKNRIQTYVKHLPMSELFSSFLLHYVLCEILVLKTLFNLKFKIAWKIQQGLLYGLIIGIQNRSNTMVKKRESMEFIKKNPDVEYYFGLFSSLKEYKKVW